MFELMHAKGLEVEAKPFAMGVRVEHPQGWVNECSTTVRWWRTGCLPPATAVCQVEGRGAEFLHVSWRHCGALRHKSR